MKDVFALAVLLFLIMDPFGNLPVFAVILSRVPSGKRRRVLARELLAALAVLLAFLWLGKPLLEILHISSPALSISGGVILFLIALWMIFPTRNSGLNPDEMPDDPLFVPLAVPLVAGPSAMTVLLIHANRHPEALVAGSISLVIAWAATAAILLLYSPLQRILGTRGLRAMERLAGMILIVLAVQMLLDGFRGYVRSLQ